MNNKKKAPRRGKEFFFQNFPEIEQKKSLFHLRIRRILNCFHIAQIKKYGFVSHFEKKKKRK